MSELQLEILLKNKEFLKVIKSFLKRDEILDIILFGSLVKGKQNPKDLDILIIYSNKVKNMIDINYELRKKINKIISNTEIIGKSYSEIFDSSFVVRESILSEGYSMKTNNFLAKSFGYSNFILFKYSLKNLNKSKRMSFYYGLYGRGKEKGILEKKDCIKFSESIILSPINKSEFMKDFFSILNISYETFPIIVPSKIFLKKR